jgi:hypothetical protein
MHKRQTVKNTSCFFFISLLLAISGYAQPLEVELPAVDHPRKNVPVFIKLPKPVNTLNVYKLVSKKTGQSLTAQLYDSVTFVFIPSEEIAAGMTETYKVYKLTYRQAQGQIHKKPNGLQVTMRGKPVFFYNTATIMPPAGQPDHYKRSGFIHPLQSPAGNVLTDDFPAGHMHQHGLFLTWVNTTFRGEKLDFWNQHAKTGTVEHAAVLDISNGPVFSRMRTRLHHVSLKHGKVLEEIWTITVYAVKDHFMFDLHSDQVNISSDTLYINKYHYGGMAFRGSKQWNRHDSLHFRNNWQILTSEGKTNDSANHSHASWVDASGPINGKMSGLTIISDPSNFRHPQSIRVHPDMPYWCFAPMVDGGFTIAPGQRYQSRYRFVVYDGKRLTL